MCGITGIFAFNLVGKFNKIHITTATMSMAKRGPDFQDIYIDDWVGLGHRRLSILDLSEKAHQPMWDRSGRYCLVFNGEIFNYMELRKALSDRGVVFRSTSDTEVLLELFVREKENCLQKLNGFFAFCVYDKKEQSFFLARDRYGEKPLLYLHDEDKFLFASEMKTLLQYGIDRELDHTSLLTYLQLNYIPAPDTIFRNVKKLLPGHYLKLLNREVATRCWYDIPSDSERDATPLIPYDEAKTKLGFLLEEAVKRRLIADVPLGVFLSGGIDSSVVTGLASRHKAGLHTFSIGFRDEKFFDETNYARLVAKHFNTEHTVFSLSNRDLYEHVEGILDYIDEPFADSSAINVYILSRETRKHSTVALSGDGADELFGGYHKHEAMNRMLTPGVRERALVALAPLWKALPQSRSTPITNFFRQAHRFAAGAKLSPSERYWRWAAFADVGEATDLLAPKFREQLSMEEYVRRKSGIVSTIPATHDLNHILFTDMKLVLANDMLTKVDSMSMAHGLEVRSPFLDYTLVDFAFTLPAHYKVNGNRRKRILQDTFRDMLPKALYNRPKKGFEVPLLKWFQKEMRALIDDDLLSPKVIAEQGLFHYPEVERLKRKLFSRDPGDVHARIWALVVFQWWLRKFGGKG